MVQEIREMIRTVYGKYDVWLRALGKFSLAFGSLLVIRNFMGYLPLLDNILILLILALVASFLPLNGMVLICFVVILGELYGLSLPSLAVGVGLLLLVALLYFGLAPQGALAFLLTPLALVLHVPLAVPVAFGLLETPLSAIGIAAGTVSYYGLKSVIGTEFVLSDPSLSMQEAFIEEMQAMLSNFLGNGEMILTLIALTAVLIAVFAVRSTEMRYAWQVAIGTGIFSIWFWRFSESSLSISRFPYRIWSSVSSRRLWWEAFCSFSFLIWITGARRNSGLRMTNIITM